MSNKKERLKYSDKALKESLEEQLTSLKESFGDAGKNALWIGGGLLGAFALIKLLSGSKKKKRAKKVVIQQTESTQEEKPVSKKKEKREKKENLLSSTLREQLIIFLLGVAVERLTKFLSELDKEEEASDDSK